MSMKTKAVKGNTERGRSERAAGDKTAITVHPNNINRDTFERATKVKPMTQADVMKNLVAALNSHEQLPLGHR